MEIQIELVSTDDLVKELCDRYEAAIIILETVHKTDSDSSTNFYFCSGGISRVLGMLERTKNRLLNNLLD